MDNPAENAGAVEAPKVAPKFEELPTRADRDAKDKIAGFPSNALCQEDVFDWYKLQETVEKAKKAEMLMRIKIFKTLFIEPKEGTNKTPLPDGWVLNAQHVINRGVDEGALQALTMQIPDDELTGVLHPSIFAKHNISADKVFKFKPELVKSEYNELTAEQKKIVDRALVMKEGSPQLKVVLPAKNDPSKQK